MAESVVVPIEASLSHADAPLDEVMLAMDVVDTLRHADRLVQRELGSDARDQQLKDRLREIYRSQGIEVTDRVLDEGVTALKEERFAYKPGGSSLARTLALAWVDRARWVRWFFAGTAAVCLYQGVRWLAFDFPAQQRREAAEQERVELPRSLTGELLQIRAVARDSDAIAVAERLVEEGTMAVKADNRPAAKAKFNELKSLRENLEQSYIIQIISGPNQKSGVYRIPAANPRARNYYVIVQAIGADGKGLSLPIFSEEDNKLGRVTRWGIRVDESVYNRIRDDKLDDGIIQNNRFGEKRKGYLKPEYAFPVQGGAILEW